MADDSGLVVVEEGQVRAAGGKGDSKANAILTGDDLKAGITSWEFDIKEGQGMFVGLGTQENFGAGYKLKGLLYGGPGNLSDGGSLLKGGWGPKFGAGDKINMKIDIGPTSTKVAFSKNGEGLGVAFNLQGWEDGVKLRPIISMGAKGECVAIKEVSAEGTFESAGDAGPGIEGDWCQPGGDCTLSVQQEGPGVWRVGAIVANSMSCLVKEEGGKMIAGEVMSTMMMPPPELQEKESAVGDLLRGITGMVREGDFLKIIAGDRQESFPRAPPPTPVTKDMVRWIK